MRAFFVTGTDTNAGKTAVGIALLQAGRKRGLRCVGYKPIESGCPVDGQGPDTLALARAAGTDPECTYALREPVAPALAADLEHIEIDPKRITAHAARLESKAELLIAEGAGGLLAPISPSQTIADLAIGLGYPLLIVAADKLGSINHALLTVEAARQRGLAIAALVLSAQDEAPSQHWQNRQQIQQHADLKILDMPFCTSDSAFAAAGDAILEHLLGEPRA